METSKYNCISCNAPLVFDSQSNLFVCDNCCQFFTYDELKVSIISANNLSNRKKTYESNLNLSYTKGSYTSSSTNSTINSTDNDENLSIMPINAYSNPDNTQIRTSTSGVYYTFAKKK